MTSSQFSPFCINFLHLKRISNEAGHQALEKLLRFNIKNITSRVSTNSISYHIYENTNVYANTVVTNAKCHAHVQYTHKSYSTWHTYIRARETKLTCIYLSLFLHIDTLKWLCSMPGGNFSKIPRAKFDKFVAGGSVLLVRRQAGHFLLYPYSTFSVDTYP